VIDIFLHPLLYKLYYKLNLNQYFVKQKLRKLPDLD